MAKFLLKNFLLLFSATCFFISHAQSQEAVREVFVKKIHPTSQKIEIDGRLTETVWDSAAPAKDFWQYFPFDTAYAMAKTEVKVIYNDQFLYLGFKCSDVNKGVGRYIATSLRRDFRGEHNDVVTVILDPFQDQTNGMLFGVSPFGVQREALISGISGRAGASTGFDLSWDNKWYAEATTHDGYWTAEMAIPFKTLRYKQGSDVWRANFYRMETQVPERSTWGHNPRNQSLLSLAFGGLMKFEEPLKKPGPNIAIIPYMAGNISRDFVDGLPTQRTFDFGGDAKIGVTPSLNLDLTVNPDFSQVEVDIQQTNITRFELFFPERRQFFLENIDIFASFGMERTRPFFSRRIGIALDPNTGLNVPNAINYGARLSGRLNKDWRLGVMNMQTAHNDAIELPGYNYSVFALQRQLFKRSNISGLLINKQATDTYVNGERRSGFDSNNYNRLAGMDFNLASGDNRWNGKFYYHQSFAPGVDAAKSYSHGVNLVYDVPAFRVTWTHQAVGKTFDPQVGFLPRNDYVSIAPTFQYVMYPNTKIASHGPFVESEFIWNDANGLTDDNVALGWMAIFKNNANVFGGFRRDYTFLFSDFNPVGEGPALPTGSDYRYYSFVAGFDSDQRKNFYFSTETRLGGFFNGQIARAAGNINYRFKQYGVATFNFAYNRIALPAPYQSGNLVLLGPRFDITFTRNLFLTTFFQYNNQIDNFNVNARLQYRFKPVSDFFLVYTDNYFPDNFRVKNRALVAKLTYWFAI